MTDRPDDNPTRSGESPFERMPLPASGDAPPAPSAPPEAWASIRTEIHPVAFAILVLAVVFFTYQVIGGVITALVTGMDMTGASVQSMRALTMASQFVLLLLPALVAVRLRNRRIGATLRLRRAAPGVILAAIASVIALQFAMQGYMSAQQYALDRWLIPDALKPLLKQFENLIDAVYARLLHTGSRGELAWVWTVVALTPAICEELLFRGVVLSAFEERLRLRWAFALNGALFALFHLNPVQFVPLAALGAFFSVLTWRTGSIIPAVAGHLANNTFAILSVYFLAGGDPMKDITAGSSPLALAAYSIAGTVVFAMCMIIVWQLTSSRSHS